MSAAECAPDRLERIIAAMESDGASVLLLGEPGSGKTRLAEEAAYAVADRADAPAAVIVLPAPTSEQALPTEIFGAVFPDLFTEVSSVAASQGFGSHAGLARRVLDAVAAEAAVEGAEPIIIAAAIDRYASATGQVIESLVRSTGVRVIATARRLSGGAERLVRHPRVQRITVGPLTSTEAASFLSRLLDGERVEFETLRRWYAITGGNVNSLSVLALALDRQGLVKRDRGMIWEEIGFAGVPEEFFTYLSETCSPEELLTLESVALAEPVSESVLLGNLNTEHLASLQSLGFVVARRQRTGETALTVSHPLLAQALTSRLPQTQRTRISDDFFRALLADLAGEDPTGSPQRLLRIVSLGLEAGQSLPLAWLTGALAYLSGGRDLTFSMRVALAVAAHDEASPREVAVAGARASQASRLLGDRSALLASAEVIRGILRRDDIDDLPATLRVSLHLELVTHLTLDQEQYGQAFQIISRLDQEVDADDDLSREMIVTARAQLFGRTGQLSRAMRECPPIEPLGRMQLEWVRGNSRVMSALVLAQQGRFDDAIQVADEARMFAVLGERAQHHVADLLTLVTCMTHLLAGATEAARETIESLQQRAITDLNQTGFIENGMAMLALNDGKWREAAQRATRVRDRLAQHDGFGMRPLSAAILALAEAALGERERARQAIRAAEVAQPGTGQMLRGLVRLLTVEARQWNGDPDAADHAARLAAWAAAESLPLIELRAFRVVATAEGHIEQAELSRVRAIAPAVDAPMGEALLAAFEEIAAGTPAWESPATRVLADLGVWLPLPRTSLLSAREREIALHAALGYSSRWIAERFHLSTRTVETHLRHVFTKLGTTNRDELRAYFRSGRAPA
ncbi:hypothetical protein GCM10009847_09760 [Leucobacter tardus]|uniref:AAA family ATPase n=1 Tax=Leucobacter tardus TaxID=501483 RepID=A0A939TMH2_9MICO|nr:LuxR C-terminal-related transcriptional regulator [Leucobacter tardus]MBO2989174.1 AAA family ATPase [Leucobacter tardus]